MLLYFRTSVSVKQNFEKGFTVLCENILINSTNRKYNDSSLAVAERQIKLRLINALQKRKFEKEEIA